VARARALRKTMTPQEVKLWVHLRKLRPEGLHFVETILARARETEGEAL
jgi:very-short-patch-repair endonuclease